MDLENTIGKISTKAKTAVAALVVAGATYMSGCTSNAGFEVTALNVKAGHKGTIRQDPSVGIASVNNDTEPYKTRLFMQGINDAYRGN